MHSASDSEELEITDYPNTIGNLLPTYQQEELPRPFAINTINNKYEPDIKKVMARDINSHVKSKSDLHFILSIEGKFHIPHLDNCSMFWMKEVLAGRKKVLKLADIRPVICPRLKEFSADKLYSLAMDDEILCQYFPDPNEQRKRPVTRQFLFNVMNPFCGCSNSLALIYVDDQHTQTSIF